MLETNVFNTIKFDHYDTEMLSMIEKEIKNMYIKTEVDIFCKWYKVGQ